MIKVIAFFGPSSSGKDTLAKVLSNRSDINEIISCTTRPMRDYEKDGVDYYFLTTEDFTKKVLNGSMLEATSFRDWFYGTTIDALQEDKINVGVFNIEGIKILLEDERIQILPVYVNASNKTRLLRCLNREQAPDVHEICRRFLKDEEDFEPSNIPACELFDNTSKELDTARLEELLDILVQD